MNARNTEIGNTVIEDTDSIATPESRFESFFRSNYERIARAVARIVGNPATAEDLAVEAFFKLWCNPQAQGERAGGWVYRTALRMGLNELRSISRRNRYERQAGFGRGSPTPEDVHAAAEEQEQVRQVLASMDPKQAELLILRGSGLSYGEVASAADVNPVSVGTLIVRAQQAFRKEYVKRYGRE